MIVLCSTVCPKVWQNRKKKKKQQVRYPLIQYSTFRLPLYTYEYYILYGYNITLYHIICIISTQSILPMCVDNTFVTQTLTNYIILYHIISTSHYYCVSYIKSVFVHFTLTTSMYHTIHYSAHVIYIFYSIRRLMQSKLVHAELFYLYIQSLYNIFSKLYVILFI